MNAKLLVALVVLQTVAQGASSTPLPLWEMESGRVSQDEMDLATQWAQAIISGQTAVDADLNGWISTSRPFSFRYGGKQSATILPTWQVDHRINRVVWTDTVSGLQLTLDVKRYQDYPAVEWMLTFENRGNKDTSLIENIQALDLRLNDSQAGEAYVVDGALGGRSLPDDLAPFSITLNSENKLLRAIDLGGEFPSSNRNLPFFTLETPRNRGVIVGIGWSGGWVAHIRAVGQQLLACAGLRRTQFVLHPGEQIRSPRILMMFWEGKRLHGNNMWRQLLYDHYVPHLRGLPQEPLVSFNTAFAYHQYGSFIEEANQRTLLPLVQPLVQLGVELFIIDAGWYEGSPYFQWVGNWRYSKTKYPRGFRPLSELLTRAQVVFGLWFTPEHAGAHVPLQQQHPEWMRTPEWMRLKPQSGSTVRFELPAARVWFLRSVNDLVQNDYLGCLRLDFFRGDIGEEPHDRKGIIESIQIAGVYHLWDSLLERHPGMVMENCASGGRRIDLETLSRFHWHQKSDRWFDSSSDQLAMYGANLYLPGGVINVPTQAVDNYGAWSSFAGQLCLGWDPLDPNFSMEEAKAQIKLYKEIRPLLHGDFYPLTRPSLEDPWIGYQFHRRDEGKGVALVFRRPNMKWWNFTAGHTLVARFRGLNPQTTYTVRLVSGKRLLHLTGGQLAHGIRVIVSKTPDAEMILYEPANSNNAQ